MAHLPRQFIQVCDTVVDSGKIDYLITSVTPPDADGFVNLGANCEVIWETVERLATSGRAKIIFEINRHLPWVFGLPESNHNRLHLSMAHQVYEHHEPLPQLPPVVPTVEDQQIAAHAARFVKDGDTIQLGIGGVPSVVASALGERRGLKIHTELLCDAFVDLVRSGAVDSHGKEHLDGLIVGTFAAGTDKLYDWLHRNPEVVLLPIRVTNDPCSIGRNRRMKAINCALMVDVHGQTCSDAIGFRQISGIGGQLEFVMGAHLSDGGLSIMCLKSTSVRRGKRVSNLVVTLPPGTPVTVPRQYADVVVTEHGVVELRHADAIERARALISIAHPDFRDQLTQQAERAGLWRRRPGFDSFVKRAVYNNIRYVHGLRQKIKGRPDTKARVLFGEVKRLVTEPDLARRLRTFYEQNRKARG